MIKITRLGDQIEIETFSGHGSIGKNSYHIDAVAFTIMDGTIYCNIGIPGLDSVQINSIEIDGTVPATFEDFKSYFTVEGPSLLPQNTYRLKRAE